MVGAAFSISSPARAWRPNRGLLEEVLHLGRVPAELAMVKHVGRRNMVPLVLQHDVLPPAVEQIREGVRDVRHPRLRRERGHMEHVMQHVDVLDAHVGLHDAVDP